MSGARPPAGIGSGRPRRRSKWLLAAISVVLTLGALEAGIRIFDAVRGRSWNARTSFYWMFEPDVWMGYRGRPNSELRAVGTTNHNADGFRDDRTLDEIQRTPGHRLVVCVGESSTYGSGAPDGKSTYPARLEAHLRRVSSDDSWFVYNAGYPAFTSYQIVQMLQLHVLPRRPTAIVLMNLRNDVELVAKLLDGRTDFRDLPRRLSLTRTGVIDFLMHSALIGFVVSRFNEAGKPNDAPTGPELPITPEGEAFYRNNYAQSALLCRRAGVPLLVVDQPIFNDAYPEGRRRATTQLRDAMKAACREHGLPLLDANEPLHASGFQSPDDVHLGPVGYDLLAEILAPQVLKALAKPNDR